MRVQLYSALYGAYDTVKPLPSNLNGVMFTDNPDLVAEGWRVEFRPHNVITRHGDARLVAPMLAHKFWKTHPAEACPEADVSIWIDASITPDPPEDFIDYAMRTLRWDDWAMVRHPWRDCIYDEAAYSAGLPRYSSLAADLHHQAGWYRQIGHPAHWGLPATGINVRRHTPAVLEMSHHWWMECLSFTHQDQVSLPVLMRLYEDRIKFNWNLGWLGGWQLWPHLK